MADPITVIGTAASILQMVSAISKGLLTLRNAVKAVKDVHLKIQTISDQIEQLRLPIMTIKHYIESRRADIEPELHIVIDNVTTNCHASLATLQAKLPKTGRSRSNICVAMELWVQDQDLEQAMKHINGYLQNLGLILGVLNLLKSDQVDAKLHNISQFLKEMGQQQAIDHNRDTCDNGRESLEVNVKIRAFANHMATSIALKEPIISPRNSIVALALAPSATSMPTERQTSLPAAIPGRKQLSHELTANRAALKRLMESDLYESAAGIQERAIEIKRLLALDRGDSWEHNDERHEMQEVLADILLQCNTKESQQDALAILQQQVSLFKVMPRDLTDSTSVQAAQKFVSLHLKLGKVYKDNELLDAAKNHLRTAFDACDSQVPKDSQMLEAIGEQLLDLHKLQVQDSDGAQRAVTISQLQGFRKELDNALGRPPTENYAEALRWCDTENIVVHKSNQTFRFDIMDEDGASSPLHIAAESCQDETVLEQIIENSDTLENCNSDDETPLFVAVENSNTAAIALLIKHGASVRVRDKERQTVLHKSQKPRVTKLLLESSLSRLRRTSSASECSNSVGHFRRASASSPTTATGTTISSLQPEDDVDIDAQDAYQHTALWTACDAGREKTVKLLLGAGADPNKCRYKSSPVAAVIESKAAGYNKHPERRRSIVAALIRYGADPRPGKDLLCRPRIIDRGILQALDTPAEPKLYFIPEPRSHREGEFWSSSAPETRPLLSSLLPQDACH